MKTLVNLTMVAINDFIEIFNVELNNRGKSQVSALHFSWQFTAVRAEAKDPYWMIVVVSVEKHSTV